MLMPLSSDNDQGLESSFGPQSLPVRAAEAGALSNQEAGGSQRDGG